MRSASEGGSGSPVASVLLLATAVLTRSLAAVFAKLAAITSVGAGMVGILINPWLLAEFAALGIGAVVWALTLRRVSLSVAYPFMSLAFGVSLAAAWFLFGEVVTAKHVAGIAIIVGGVAFANWPVRDRA